MSAGLANALREVSVSRTTAVGVLGVRLRYLFIASASVGPYLNTNAADDSTTGLADGDEMALPPQPVCFLPDAQQGFLVKHSIEIC